MKITQFIFTHTHNFEVIQVKDKNVGAYTSVSQNSRLFKMIVGGHTKYTPDATPCDFFLWGYVKDQFMFLLFSQVSRN